MLTVYRASAGAGKTHKLTGEYLKLLFASPGAYRRILAVTFTNKAANEMKTRIRSMLGDVDTGYISTFHGFCLRVLKEDIHRLNYPQNFMVMDEEDQKVIKIYITSEELNAYLPINVETGEVLQKTATLADFK